MTISGGTISDSILTGSSYAGQSGTVSALMAGSLNVDQDDDRNSDAERDQYLYGNNDH